MNKRLIICDLDGTLYDSTQRSQLAQNGQWDLFHEASSQDPPNDDVLKALYALDNGENEIIAITGRNEKFRPITLKWFDKYHVPIETLLMRPDNDFRSDKELKIGLLEDWLDCIGRDKSELLFALEDRDKMVDAWREYGIPCWQVRVGAY
jgi:FMN phosphatase YigB (HAD superfamily)